MATRRSSSEASVHSAQGGQNNDLEKGAALVNGLDAGTNARSDRYVKEAAGLLFAFSLFALVEGTSRMVQNSTPAAAGEETDFTTSGGGTMIPVAVLLAGGVAEVFFGLAGCYVAIYSLMFEINSAALSTAFAIVQSVLGWFVFLTYVVAGPILRARFDENGFDSILSLSEYRALVIIGEMFGGITFCYALQGGQFIMALNLAAAQKGEEWSKKKSMMRSVIWSVNAIVASFSTIFVGSMLAARNLRDTGMFFPAPPHVVWYPALSLVTGLIMLAYGAVCLMAAKMDSLTRVVGLMFPIVTTMMLANFSWVFGEFPGVGPPIVGALQHVGLVFSVTILPAYHALRVHRDP